MEVAFHKALEEEAFRTKLDKASRQEFQGQSLLTASLVDTSWGILGAFNHQVPFKLLEVSACQGASAVLEEIITTKSREVILAFLFIYLFISKYILF